jgi:adenylyltransferase/sulfurtransferase
MQATEVVKLAMDYGESLEGRLLAYDAGSMHLDEVPITQHPDCPVCGDEPAIETVGEATYEGQCSLAGD